MAEPSSDMEMTPEAPAGAKKGMSKILAIVVALVLILVAVGAYLLLSKPAVQPPPVNQAPVLQTVTADRSAADIATVISFTATATDPDGDNLTYSWNFGDGTALGSSAAVQHGYALAGNFIATVTVSDGQGHTVTGEAKAIFLLVNHPETRSPGLPTDQPNPVAVMSANKSVIQVNSTVAFNGNASWTWAYDVFAGPAWTFQDAASNASAITNLRWSWGDATADTTGTPNTAGSVTHKFTSTGTKAVKLTATNNLAKTDQVGYTIVVTPAAPPAIGVKNPSVFTEATFGEPDSLDPAFDYETSGGEVIQNVAESLVWYNGAAADQFRPQLAVKVPLITNPADVSPNGKTWNFTLKPNLKFHSGNNVDCNAVSFSIKRVLKLNDGRSPAWILDQSLTAYAVDNPATPAIDERQVAIDASVSCPNGGTGLAVQFHLAIPYPPFLATLAFTAADVIDPTPSAYRVTSRCPSTDLMANYCDDQLVGTGPFKLRAWQPNQQIILDKNPTYWNAGVKAVPFNEVHIVKANDVATRVLMMKAGDADVIILPTNHVSDVRDTSGRPLPGIQEQSGNTFIVQFLGFNQNINVGGAPPGDVNVPANFFTDVHLRKAFSYAWKYTDFIQNVINGFGSPLCGPIPAGMAGFDPTVPCYPFDLTKAQAEFQQALDPRSANPTDTYWDNGFTITIYYNIGNLVREEGARQLAATLLTLNPAFNLKVQGLEWAAFLNAVSQKWPALFFLGWAPDYADPDDYVVPFLHTGQFFPNRVTYSNTTNDALIDQQAQELNPATRLSLLATIQRAPYYDVPYIWLYQSKNYNVLRSWVTGYYSNPMTTAGTGYYYYDLDK